MSRTRVELHQGDRIGAWTVEWRLGGGSLGCVYAASDLADNQVALKVWGGERLSFALRDRFFEVATLAGSLEHPNLGVLYDAGDTPSDLCFAATGRLQGATLRRLLERGGPLVLRHALHFACQLVRALEALSAVGLSHHDLHAGQVFVEFGGSARLLDTGERAVKEALGLVAASDLAKAPTDVAQLAELFFQMLGPGGADEPPLRGCSSLWACLRAALSGQVEDQPSVRELALELRGALRSVVLSRPTPLASGGTLRTSPTPEATAHAVCPFARWTHAAEPSNDASKDELRPELELLTRRTFRLEQDEP